jgi:hypothetical protein
MVAIRVGTGDIDREDELQQRATQWSISFVMGLLEFLLCRLNGSEMLSTTETSGRRVIQPGHGRNASQAIDGDGQCKRRLRTPFLFPCAHVTNSRWLYAFSE